MEANQIKEFITKTTELQEKYFEMMNNANTYRFEANSIIRNKNETLLNKYSKTLKKAISLFDEIITRCSRNYDTLRKVENALNILLTKVKNKEHLSLNNTNILNLLIKGITHLNTDFQETQNRLGKAQSLFEKTKSNIEYLEKQ